MTYGSQITGLPVNANKTGVDALADATSVYEMNAYVRTGRKMSMGDAPHLSDEYRAGIRQMELTFAEAAKLIRDTLILDIAAAATFQGVPAQFQAILDKNPQLSTELTKMRDSVQSTIGEHTFATGLSDYLTQGLLVSAFPHLILADIPDYATLQAFTVQGLQQAHTIQSIQPVEYTSASGCPMYGLAVSLKRPYASLAKNAPPAAYLEFIKKLGTSQDPEFVSARQRLDQISAGHQSEREIVGLLMNPARMHSALRGFRTRNRLEGLISRMSRQEIAAIVSFPQRATDARDEFTKQYAYLGDVLLGHAQKMKAISDSCKLNAEYFDLAAREIKRAADKERPLPLSFFIAAKELRDQGVSAIDIWDTFTPVEKIQAPHESLDTLISTRISQSMPGNPHGEQLPAPLTQVPQTPRLAPPASVTDSATAGSTASNAWQDEVRALQQQGVELTEIYSRFPHISKPKISATFVRARDTVWRKKQRAA